MECENPVFRTESLTFSYPGGEPVLKDLSLELAEGKITTIIGANGCGKSTLLNLLTRNLTPDSGSIYLNDRPVGEIKSKDYAKEVALSTRTTQPLPMSQLAVSSPLAEHPTRFAVSRKTGKRIRRSSGTRWRSPVWPT